MPVVTLVFFILQNSLVGAWRTPSSLPQTMIETVVWISLVQFLFGVGLIIYEVWKNKNVFSLILAALLTVIPFVWWIFR